MSQQSKVWLLIGGFFLLVLGACAGPGPIAAGDPAGDEQAPRAGTALEAPLQWQGYSEFADGDGETCKRLRMVADGTVEIGPCGAEGEILKFPGQADLESPAWQRAIETWVEFTYGEQVTGQRGAATRTVMSWWLGESPDQVGYCRHLLVLVYGYAYANVDPCEGGTVLSTTEGWLQTDELESFDAWLYNRAPLFVDNHYFDGRGDQDMSAAEIEQMAQWAEALYHRLSAQQPQAQPAANNRAAGLIWEGYAPIGGAGTAETCQRLVLTPAGEATFGPCGETDQSGRLLDHQARAWADIQEQFASFALAAPEVQLLFAGTGEVTGPAWQRALATWAEDTSAELSNGRVSATPRTTLSWWLGEAPGHPGACRRLLVLVYGYAHADIAPCAGGEALSHSEGWLQTDEMVQFDAWRYQQAPVYQENNYLDGKGTEEMATAGIADLTAWATGVYTRIVESDPTSGA